MSAALRAGAAMRMAPELLRPLPTAASICLCSTSLTTSFSFSSPPFRVCSSRLSIPLRLPLALHGSTFKPFSTWADGNVTPTPPPPAAAAAQSNPIESNRIRSNLTAAQYSSRSASDRFHPLTHCASLSRSGLSPPSVPTPFAPPVLVADDDILAEIQAMKPKKSSAPASPSPPSKSTANRSNPASPSTSSDADDSASRNIFAESDPDDELDAAASSASASSSFAAPIYANGPSGAPSIEALNRLRSRDRSSRGLDSHDDQVHERLNRAMNYRIKKRELEQERLKAEKASQK